MFPKSYLISEPDTALCAPSLRRAYHAPRLELLGDLRGLTLGGSPGTADSANLFSCDPSQGCLNQSDPFNDLFSGGSGH